MFNSISAFVHFHEKMTTTGMPLTILSIEKLLVHEMYNDVHMTDLSQKITSDQIFTRPVLVDQKDFILLDGHHRYWALRKQLGATYIPAVLIDYEDTSLVSVSSWQKNVQVDRQCVRQAAFTGKLLPFQTSKHCVSFDIGEICVPLHKLGVKS